jgi:hypothetical protein
MNLGKFEMILKMTQKQLKQYLTQELKQLGYKPINKNGFLYAEGSAPVMLVAHLDTVHSQTPQLFLYSKDNRFITSPTGIGGDDRCGIYMMLEIIKTHKCHILFTEDEEIGGVGAKLFTKSNIKPNINYMIELDRQGSNDCVYYDDENSEFHKYISDFGFKKEHGSFSDISFIAPSLGISAVNISCGYYDAHTLREKIDLKVITTNIKRVKEIISTKTEKFEYVESESYFNTDFYNNLSNTETELMHVENGYVINENGELLDGYDFFIDKNNKLYEYDYSNDICFPIEGQAFNENGMPLIYEDNIMQRLIMNIEIF